jgi:uncharacterized membrane protein
VLSTGGSPLPGGGRREDPCRKGRRNALPHLYPLLSSTTSLEAVLLAAFVLIKQNRMSTMADRRYHLDPQVNLLTGRETTRIIQMLVRVSSHLGIEQHRDADSREMNQHIAVEHLVDELI